MKKRPNEIAREVRESRMKVLDIFGLEHARNLELNGMIADRNLRMERITKQECLNCIQDLESLKQKDERTDAIILRMKEVCEKVKSAKVLPTTFASIYFMEVIGDVKGNDPESLKEIARRCAVNVELENQKKKINEEREKLYKTPQKKITL